MHNRNQYKNAQSKNHRLGDFIRENMELITKDWIAFAETLDNIGEKKSSLVLKDHIGPILTFLADDLDSPQTANEQRMKSQGLGKKSDDNKEGVSKIHAILRLEEGFSINEMTAEYRALRASIVRLWTFKKDNLDKIDFYNLIRLNESIDQVMMESIFQFTKKLDHSRNMFLGILGHDLRNPIGAASMSAQLMLKLGILDPRHQNLALQIIKSTTHANKLLISLIDLARMGFNSDLSIVKNHMDIGEVGNEIVDEMKVLFSDRQIILKAVGDMNGEWDKVRIGQIFSNLISNAIQYSFPDTPITITLEGKDHGIILSVHNTGTPIPADKISRIFDSLTRNTNEGEEIAGSVNLGLGLYITKQIVDLHGGEINVTSSDQEGTKFTVSLPRYDGHLSHRNFH